MDRPLPRARQRAPTRHYHVVPRVAPRQGLRGRGRQRDVRFRRRARASAEGTQGARPRRFVGVAVAREVDAWVRNGLAQELETLIGSRHRSQRVCSMRRCPQTFDERRATAGERRRADLVKTLNRHFRRLLATPDVVPAAQPLYVHVGRPGGRALHRPRTDRLRRRRVFGRHFPALRPPPELACFRPLPALPGFALWLTAHGISRCTHVAEVGALCRPCRPTRQVG